MGAQTKKPKKQGFDELAQDPESPVHKVTISPFVVSRFLVTVEQYGQFIAKKGNS